ncbi:MULTISPECIES: helix-turn-helix domain-containing protein [Providencia]|uniref:helix-turn-helix domain-containing protein n=1 Tax=Providencia TaxID=586 RepID=UPI0003E2BE9F|nr:MULTISPECIES: helix-turn-helix transcriptional regulator [Providencia]ETS98964.1 DNA-binding helix-turn-helix protein [Providencia alcalifaciens PAL-3]ETT05640.1 DNA-binding helix-turn-helix protein [Providencia alcalifaciens F90-2004]EUC99419.1 DNA-binding helix-turn-helix protein [Providencia alcalifaciens PAL-1]MTC21293.1 helix-turn-helix domain-containing protein [Providencia sp. wls1938]MTC22172.1 helix-turn-helix domain-containing protein [Providencia sp. wls1938]
MEKSNNSPKAQKQIIPMEGLIRFPDRLNLVMEGMTNVELASKTGLTEATIRNYRKGKSYPTLDKLKELAEACNCPLDWLATGSLNQNEIRKNEIDFESEFKDIFAWLSSEEKIMLISFIRREGINSLLRLTKSNLSTVTHNSIDEQIDNLPIRPLLKKAIKIGLANNGEYDKEILHVLEEIESKNQRPDLAQR